MNDPADPVGTGTFVKELAATLTFWIEPPFILYETVIGID